MVIVMESFNIESKRNKIAWKIKYVRKQLHNTYDPDLVLYYGAKLEALVEVLDVLQMGRTRHF
jgi:hypothetical protein